MKHRPDPFNASAQKSENIVRLEGGNSDESGNNPLEPERAPIFTPVFLVELGILTLTAFLIGKIPSPELFVGLLAVYAIVHFFVIPKLMR